MKKIEEIFGGWNLTDKSAKKWVEMKNCGLKIGEILGSLAY